MSKDVYQIVTDKIIESLRAGQIPWQKPWTGLTSGAFNRVSKKPYSFLNQILLPKPGEWASFKQWSDLGGHIRKGEKSSIVVFWKVIGAERETTTDEGEVTTERKMVPMLRYIPVFHISQVDGVEPLVQSEAKKFDPVEEAEKVISGYFGRENAPKLEEVAGDRAYYSPLQDLVVTPLKEQFRQKEEYYSTLFHETVHSTGHKSRLDRFEKGSQMHFGSCDYSKEELVAEMGAAYLLAHLGIDTEKSFKNSAAYIQSWLKVLQDDKRFVVSAASRAQKAVDFILGSETI